jgi:purine-binding chemotaxis protein CheW
VVIVEVAIDGETIVVGLMADTVSQVIELPPELVEPPPSFGTRLRADYLVGMGRTEKKFVLMLDIDRVLANPHALAAIVADAAERAEGIDEASREGAAGSTAP